MTSSEPDAYSVGDLLRIRRSDERWHLALVQRDEVWDVDRMRRLLDSLLAGYPVGALLLCRTAGISQVIRREGGRSEVAEAAPGAWQLLDGQQRINALFTTLTPGDKDHERYGRFFLNLTAERPAPNPEAGRSDRQLGHIIWRDPMELIDGATLDDFPERPRCIDLSLVYDWAQANKTFERFDERVRGDVAGVVADLDRRFAHALTAHEAETARRWLLRLAHLWRDPRIPVMKAEVDTPEDLLELFARLNRSGIPFHDADIYFAAVKTFWPDAEPSLKRVIEATTVRVAHGADVQLLQMDGALRLVSRLAARALSRGDVLPLRVGRISGASREPMVRAMSQLTAEGSEVLSRLTRFTADFGSGTELGYAARLVRAQLWDEVLAWAAVRGRWDESDLQAIDSYLLGASLFSYPTVFGTAFNLLSLVEALVAATRDESFPSQRIIVSTRVKYPELKRSSRQVLPLQPPADAGEREQQRLTDDNTSLLLSLAQRIPLHHDRPLDVDHIYPSALARRMHGVHPRSHHPQRWRVNSSGNKWLLDFSLNRSLQDLPPRAKFERLLDELDSRPAETAGIDASKVWAREQWAIEDGEIDQLHQVDELLQSNIDAAMRVFADVTSARAQRLLGYAMDRFPQAKEFALDSEPELADPAELTTDETAALAARLGLDVATHSTLGAAPRPAGLHLPLWTDREVEIEWVMKDGSKKFLLSNNSQARANRTQTGSRAEDYGFVYVRWVQVRAPEPATHVGVGVPMDEGRSAAGPLWMVLHAGTPGYAIACERLRHSEPAGLEEDEMGTWVPLHLDPLRRWNELSDQVAGRLADTVSIITGP
jgi:hypothetical protein